MNQRYRLQSTLEFSIIAAIIVAVVLIVFFSLYSKSISSTNYIKNLTTEQFNIYNFNIYFSNYSDELYGNYYQSGNLYYSSANFDIIINGKSYLVSTTVTQRNSTLNSIYSSIASSSLSGTSLGNILIGNKTLSATIVYIRFSEGGTNYLSLINQSVLIGTT